MSEAMVFFLMLYGIGSFLTYFTSYIGDMMQVFDHGWRMKIREFSELSDPEFIREVLWFIGCALFPLLWTYLLCQYLLFPIAEIIGITSRRTVEISRFVFRPNYQLPDEASPRGGLSPTSRK